MDLFEVIRCKRPCQGADKSVALYVESLKAGVACKRIDRFIWIDNAFMLADSVTKNMVDVLWRGTILSGEWWSSHFLFGV